MEYESLISAKQLSTECLYPTLIENSRFNDAEKTFNRNMRTLRASRLGVVRLEFSSIDAVHQLGENIDKDKPLHIVIMGRDTSESKSQKIVVLSLNTEGVIKVLSQHNLADIMTSASKVFIENVKSDKCTRMVLQKDNQIKIYKIVKQSEEELNLEEERTLNL